MRENLARLITLGFVAMSATAGAQWDPESGDTGQWQPPPEEEQQQQQQQQQPPPEQQPPAGETPWGGQQQQQQQQQQQPAWGAQTEEPPTAEPQPAGDTDHSKVSFGLSFFGFERFQVEPRDRVSDPTAGAFQLGITTIGVRLWISEMLGVDIGLGLGVKTDDYSNDDPAAPGVTAGQDGAFGLRIHVGLPVALKTYEHFNILLIPEVAFTYASTSYIVDLVDPNFDIDVSAIAFDLGVKVGGELQFGFWGVPNLSLQATVGLGFRYASRTAENSVDFASGGVGITSSNIDIQTVAQQLGSMIRLNYYF